jgi:hypothetical protein
LRSLLSSHLYDINMQLSCQTVRRDLTIQICGEVRPAILVLWLEHNVLSERSLMYVLA